MRIAAHPIILTIIIFFLFLQPAARSIINGRLAEWSMAAVLKTVERQRSGGSNPSPSAKQKTAGRVATGCFWLQARRKLAFVRDGRQNGQLARRDSSCIPFCTAPPQAERDVGGRQPDEIPEGKACPMPPQGMRGRQPDEIPKGEAWPMPPHGMRGRQPDEIPSQGMRGPARRNPGR